MLQVRPRHDTLTRRGTPRTPLRGWSLARATVYSAHGRGSLSASSDRSAPRRDERQVYGFHRNEGAPPWPAGHRGLAGDAGHRRIALSLARRWRWPIPSWATTGSTGRHRLADMYDSPGAVCDIVLPGRDSLGETWLRVNPPIMFAINRTGGVDEQQIGWRATVSALNEDTGAWRVVRRSAMTRTVATDQARQLLQWSGLAGRVPTHARDLLRLRRDGLVSTRTIRARSKVARPTRSSIS